MLDCQNYRMCLSSTRPLRTDQTQHAQSRHNPHTRIISQPRFYANDLLPL